MRSRTSGNSGVEADALARLLSMDPNDPATKLELLRLKVRDPHIAFKELEQLVGDVYKRQLWRAARRRKPAA